MSVLAWAHLASGAAHRSLNSITVVVILFRARPVCVVSAGRGAVAQVPAEEEQDTVCCFASAHNR